MMPRASLYPFLLLALLLAAASGARAHPKTDVLHLYNGDRLTGEIQALNGGLVTLGTDALGTVEVEWQEVATMESRYYYEARLASGERVFGTLAAPGEPGVVALQSGGDERRLPWQELIELRPIAAKVRDRLEIYSSLNFAFNRASGVATSEIKGEISYEDENTRNTATARNTVTRTQEITTSSSRISLGRELWTDRAEFFRLISGGFERNDELGLDQRYNVGIGVGRYFLDRQTTRLSGAVSLRALHERGEGGGTTESLEAEFRTGYGVWRFDDPDLDLRFDLSLYPSLTESGRLRGESELRLKWEIYRDLFWDVSAWGSYDNQALDEEADRAFDWGLSTGVGWEF